MYQHSRVRVQIGDRTHRADVADAGAWGWTSAGTCQEHTAGASVPRSQFDLHMGVAKAPWCNLHLLYTPCPCAVPIIPLERNHSLRSGKMLSSSPVLSIVAPVSPLASVWTTMTPL